MGPPSPVDLKEVGEMRVALIVLMFVLFGPPLVIWLLRSVRDVREISAESRGTHAAS